MKRVMSEGECLGWGGFRVFMRDGRSVGKCWDGWGNVVNDGETLSPRGELGGEGGMVWCIHISVKWYKWWVNSGSRRCGGANEPYKCKGYTIYLSHIGGKAWARCLRGLEPRP